MCIRDRPVDDLLAPRANAERLGVGPGDVPEGDDGRLGQAVADHARQPVSYTHLRAPETVLDILCRLLLEKKKI